MRTSNVYSCNRIWGSHDIVIAQLVQLNPCNEIGYEGLNFGKKQYYHTTKHGYRDAQFRRIEWQKPKLYKITTYRLMMLPVIICSMLDSRVQALFLILCHQEKMIRLKFLGIFVESNVECPRPFVIIY